MRYSDVPTIREMLYQQFNARICLVDIYYIYKLAEKESIRQYCREKVTTFRLYHFNGSIYEV